MLKYFKYNYTLVNNMSSMAELTLPKRKGYKRTVTISPDKKLWNEFKSLINRQYGLKMQSAVIDMLVDFFNKNATYDYPIEFFNGLIVKVTLSVDIEIWSAFSDRVVRLFSKKKIKSTVISTLIKQYIADHKDV